MNPEIKEVASTWLVGVGFRENMTGLDFKTFYDDQADAVAPDALLLQDAEADAEADATEGVATTFDSLLRVLRDAHEKSMDIKVTVDGTVYRV